MRTSFNKVSPEVRKVLHGYSTPYTPTILQRFRRAYKMLRDMTPKPNVMKLNVMHCNINGFYDEETLKMIQKEDPEAHEGAYTIVFTPWEDILGMEVSAWSHERLSLEAIVANCLYEMLYMGLEEERSKKKKREES